MIKYILIYHVFKDLLVFINGFDYCFEIEPFILSWGFILFKPFDKDFFFLFFVKYSSESLTFVLNFFSAAFSWLISFLLFELLLLKVLTTGKSLVNLYLRGELLSFFLYFSLLSINNLLPFIRLYFDKSGLSIRHPSPLNLSLVFLLELLFFPFFFSSLRGVLTSAF